YQLLELPKRIYRDMLILQQLGNLRANSIQQVPLSLDVRHVDVESFCKTLFRDTTIERLHNHPVLLDDSHTIDTFVVGECFIISRNEADHIGAAKVSENFEPQVTI